MEDDLPIYLLADANVLIDLAQAGALMAVRMLTENRLAAVHMPRCIFDEISREVSEAAILDAGINLIPMSIALLQKVQALDERRLSNEDKALLLIAMENAYTVWTNDKALIRCCQARSVAAEREFAVLKRLVAARLLTAEALIEIARTVETNNPMMKGVADTLKAEL